MKAPVAWAIFSLFAAPLAAYAAPTVSFKAPANGQTISGNLYQSSACEVAGSSIAQVKFYLGSTALNTENNQPWECNLDSTKFANGSYTLRAVAYDSAGASKSTQITVNIQNGTTTSSGLSFKAPAGGQTLSGSYLDSSACEVTGSAISIARVKFFLGATALNTESYAPWQCNFDTRSFPNGTYALKAQALDSAGRTTGTAQVSVNIQNGTTTQNGTTGNTAPTIAILKPNAGATLTAPVNSSGCEASASDPGGAVSRVDFVLRNATTSASVGSKTAAPYQCAIDTSKFADGSYTLMATATDNQGATSSTQRTISIKKAAPPVAASDIITRASADVPFANQSGYSAQVIQTSRPAAEIPESGIHGTTLPNGETMRLGKMIDPANSSRKALAFQVTGSDPTTSGGKRSELAAAHNIEMNKVYWIVFSAYIYNWGTLASGDNALFGTQMHTGDNDAGVGGPSFGLYTTQNGRYFRVQARYSTSSTPTASNSVSVKYAEYPIPFGRWAEFVLKFRHNTSGNGFLQVWMDGNLIASHQGSLGYNTGMKDYAKFGYYNWSASAMNGTARKVLLRSPTIVSDPTGQTYSLAQIRALLTSAQ